MKFSFRISVTPGRFLAGDAEHLRDVVGAEDAVEVVLVQRAAEGLERLVDRGERVQAAGVARVDRAQVLAQHRA